MEILESFGVNWKLLVASTINFVILLVLLNKILYQPLLQVLDERRARIGEGLKNADEAEQKLVETMAKEKQILHTARLKADSIITGAEKQAAERRAELLADAAAEARRVVQKAGLAMEQEAARREETFKQQVAEVVVAATRAILQKSTPPTLTKEYASATLKKISGTA